MADTVRPPVNSELLDEIKRTYPEVEGLKAKAVVDWALRKLVKEAQQLARRGYVEVPAKDLVEVRRLLSECRGIVNHKEADQLGLSAVALKRHMPRLPSGLNLKLVEEAKADVEAKLKHKFGAANEAKVDEVKRLLLSFRDGSVPSELNYREYYWGAGLLLFELAGNRSIKGAVQLSSSVACYSPRHIKRLPISTITTESRLLEALPDELRLLVEECSIGD